MRNGSKINISHHLFGGIINTIFILLNDKDMILNTYKYENNGVTATITNKKRYWLLEISCNDRIILIAINIWNTKRSAKKYAMNILAQY